jgi:hypothetical protein
MVKAASPEGTPGPASATGSAGFQPAGLADAGVDGAFAPSADGMFALLFTENIEDFLFDNTHKP